MNTSRIKKSVALAAALATASCATGPNGQMPDLPKAIKGTFASDDPCSNNARNIGIVAGMVLGGVLAKTASDGKAKSVAMGIAAGGAFGGFVGADVDRRRCELYKVAKAHNLDIAMTDVTLASSATASGATATSNTSNTNKKPEPVGMSLTVFDRGQQFLSGSAAPSAEAIKAFADVADQYSAPTTDKDAQAMQVSKHRLQTMRLLFVGHTDDTGSSAANADLSEERARAVARIFSQRGFRADQIFYQGAGEVFPIDDNRTETGRGRNRRVEIVDLSDEDSFAAFLAARKPNVSHYRPAVHVEASARAASSSSAPSGKLEAGSALAKTPLISAVAAAKEKNAPPVKVEKADVAFPVPKTTSSADGFDFGGKPVNGHFKSIDIGKTARASTVSIISTAYAADEAPVGSCASDRPRVSRGVKSLSSGQVIKTSAYLPGTAGTSWAGKANGHLLGLTGVTVLRDGAQPASRPTFYVWKNFVDGSKANADFKAVGDVNAYQGDRALLYRVFLNDGPVRCLDVVIPNAAPNSAPSSNIVYDRNSAAYQADYSPVIAR